MSDDHQPDQTAAPPMADQPAGSTDTAPATASALPEPELILLPRRHASHRDLNVTRVGGGEIAALLQCRSLARWSGIGGARFGVVGI